MFTKYITTEGTDNISYASVCTQHYTVGAA